MKLLSVILVLVVLTVIFLSASTYRLDEIEQAVIVQFGAPVGESKKEPGLYFKTPFIQEVRRFDKRIQAWDGAPKEIPTRGREFILADTTARWRIDDPLTFLESVKNERGAQSRLDDVIASVVRDKISSNELIEIVRSKGWKVDVDEIDRADIGKKELELLRKKIRVGREQLEKEILEEAKKLMPQFGIKLIDVRIKRLNYISSVQNQVFRRMIAERQRVAAEFRSEGEGRSAEILGKTQKQVAQISSEAERQAEIIRGEGDAAAIGIYNEAYSLDPEFFAFLRTLESYDKSIGKDVTIIIDMDSDYFQYLRKIAPTGLSPPPETAQARP